MAVIDFTSEASTPSHFNKKYVFFYIIDFFIL
jgi:hypothetical protein